MGDQHGVDRQEGGDGYERSDQAHHGRAARLVHALHERSAQALRWRCLHMRLLASCLHWSR
jgi:hypothetical protein